MLETMLMSWLSLHNCRKSYVCFIEYWWAEGANTNHANSSADMASNHSTSIPQSVLTHLIRKVVKCFSTTSSKLDLDAPPRFRYVSQGNYRDVISVVERSFKPATEEPNGTSVYHRKNYMHLAS